MDCPRCVNGIRGYVARNDDEGMPGTVGVDCVHCDGRGSIGENHLWVCNVEKSGRGYVFKYLGDHRWECMGRIYTGGVIPLYRVKPVEQGWV